MPGDSHIYGMDETAMAARIASDALTPGGSEDVHGGLTESRANAKDGAGTQPGDVATKRDSPDSRARSKGGHPCT